MTPPLALDVDGTLTRPDAPGIDPRIWDPIASWPEPVVVATGKAFPYPVALCHFAAVPIRVVAENGGVAFADGELSVLADGTAAREAAAAYEDAGYSLGWGDGDPVNRWRETEVAIAREQPEEPLREIAAAHGLDFVDSGYAYHLKEPGIDKGDGLEAVAEAIGVDPDEFVAIGDSENDVGTFERAKQSYAVANADETAKAAADEVLEQAHADGTLAVLERLRSVDE